MNNALYPSGSTKKPQSSIPEAEGEESLELADKEAPPQLNSPELPMQRVSSHNEEDLQQLSPTKRQPSPHPRRPSTMEMPVSTSSRRLKPANPSGAEYLKAHTGTPSDLTNDDSTGAFVEERRRLLRDIAHYFSCNQFNPAIMRCKKLVKLTERLYQRSESQDPFPVCADYLLFAKTLLRMDRTREARNELLHLKRFVIENIPDTKIDYRRGARENEKLSIGIMNLKKITSTS